MFRLTCVDRRAHGQNRVREAAVVGQWFQRKRQVVLVAGSGGDPALRERRRWRRRTGPYQAADEQAAGGYEVARAVRCGIPGLLVGDRVSGEYRVGESEWVFCRVRLGDTSVIRSLVAG